MLYKERTEIIPVLDWVMSPAFTRGVLLEDERVRTELASSGSRGKNLTIPSTTSDNN